MQFDVLRQWDISDSSLHRIFESENVKFPFFYEK